MLKHDKGETFAMIGMIALAIISTLLWLGFVGGLIYVAIHFIAKFW